MLLKNIYQKVKVGGWYIIEDLQVSKRVLAVLFFTGFLQLPSHIFDHFADFMDNAAAEIRDKFEYAFVRLPNPHNNHDNNLFVMHRLK